MALINTNSSSNLLDSLLGKTISRLLIIRMTRISLTALLSQSNIPTFGYLVTKELEKIYKSLSTVCTVVILVRSHNSEAHLLLLFPTFFNVSFQESFQKNLEVKEENKLTSQITARCSHMASDCLAKRTISKIIIHPCGVGFQDDDSECPDAPSQACEFLLHLGPWRKGCMNVFCS